MELPVLLINNFNNSYGKMSTIYNNLLIWMR
jgi:hypothetical protein